jgi:hypothetical protein
MSGVLSARGSDEKHLSNSFFSSLRVVPETLFHSVIHSL